MKTSLLSEKIVTPNELLRLLDRHQLMTRPKGKPSELLEQGFLFQNRVPFQVYALGLLTGQKESLSSLKEHYKKSFNERLSLYQDVSKSVEKLAAIVALEEIALDLFVTRLNENLLNRAFNSAVENAKEIMQSYMKSVDYFNLFSAPHEFVGDKTYGIPQLPELTAQASAIQQKWEDRKKNDDQRRQILRSLFGVDHMAEKAAMEKYIETTRAQLFETFAN